MNTRMNRNRLNIGTYFLHPYARSEKHIREMKECGIDFVVCFNDDRTALDLFAKYDTRIKVLDEFEESNKNF